MARSRVFLRAGARVARVLDAIGLERMRRRVPGLGLVPAHAGTRRRVQESPRIPHPRVRVVLMHGCGTTELRPSIAESSLAVLRHNEFDVVELGAGYCCGALSLHAGDVATARGLARETATALVQTQTEFVVTSAAGCGAMLRQYRTFLADDLAVRDTARWISTNTRDVSEALVEAGLRKPGVGMGDDRRVAYHDACHLLHGAGIADAPRALIAAAGATVVDLGENDICCGSAGTYNLLQPRNALHLGSRKAELVAAAKVDTIVVGNVGCILQLERSLAMRGLAGISVLHPVELLARAYRNEPR